MPLRLSRLAVLAVIGVHLALCYYGSRVLPDRVASHFDFQGHANGWSSRGQFLVLFGALTGLIAFLGFGVPALIARLPAAYVNLPNRDYWLAPERKAETLVALADELAWMAFLTGALLVAIFWRTIEFNVEAAGSASGSDAMGGALWITGGYLVAIGLWTVRLYLRFRKPAGE